MPEHVFAPPPTEPLFPEDDPFTLTLPGVGTFRLLDRANPPIEDDEVDPTTKPVAYYVETTALQVVPEQRDEAREALIAAVRSNVVLVDQLIEACQWIGKTRQEAQKAATARVVQRPTPGAPHSTP